MASSTRHRQAVGCIRRRWAPALLRQRGGVAFLLIYLIYAALPGPRAGAEPRLQTLTTARAAHQLSLGEAARAYPVHLRAIVLFYDLYLDHGGTPVLFVADDSGSIYVALKSRPPVDLEAGDLVDINGVSSPGLFAPIVDHAQAQVIGKSHLPFTATRTTLVDMQTGNDDGQWAEVKGLVRSVRASGPHVFLDLLLGDGTVTAVTGRRPGVDYSRLLDSGVLLRGVVSPNFNRQRQVTGAHLLFPGPESLKVIESGNPDPFSQPIQAIDSLLRFNPHQRFQHRVHIRGALTLLWPGRMICVEDGTKNLCAETKQTSTLSNGDLVEVVGFPTIGAFTPTLVEALFRPVGGRLEIEVPEITAKEAMDGTHDAQLVSIEAKVIDKSRSEPDPNLTLSSGGFVFSAILPRQLIKAGSTPLVIGSVVRLTGICSLQAVGTSGGLGEGFSVVQSFRILQRSTADIVVVERPSWWSAEHTLYVLAVALTLIGLAVAAILFLRYRIKQQTATIRAQLAETTALRHAAEFQAMHDGLTGIFNRRAIFDALHRELALAGRSGSTTGLLMLDLDHFKRINDTHGHFAGDCVLKEAVRRIQEVARSSDLAGRYGGEEFLVVLPGCSRDQLKTCAERIRAVIADSPMEVEGVLLHVTVSVGAIAADHTWRNEQDILTAADRALYRAKHSGRNRVVFHDSQPSYPPAAAVVHP